MIRIFSQYISVKSILLSVLEGSMVVLALFCAVQLRFWQSPGELALFTRWPDFTLQATTFAAAFIICFHYGDINTLPMIRGIDEQLIYIGQSIGAACMLLGIAYFIFPGLLIGRGVFFISTALVAAFVLLTRVALDRAWQAAAPSQNIAIMGTEAMALTVARELTRRGDLNIRLAGFIDTAPTASQESVFGHPVLGTVANLETLVHRHNISRIVVAMPDRRGRLPIRELVTLRVNGLRVEDAHSTISSLTGRVWLDTVRPSWFVFSDGFHRSKLNSILKRSIDLAFGILGLVLSAPLMLLVAAAIRLDSKGPVLFWQTRVGLGGRPFDLVKFRSMRVDAEESTGAQWAQKDDPRVSRVGKFIRKYRLDELPQFINIIRGEMSFVGPRPERPVFVERLRKEISYYDERHSVRPGLTGWAQTQYEYGASLEDAFRKLEYDLFYLKNMSVFFDVAIILQTVRIVLTGHGAR